MLGLIITADSVQVWFQSNKAPQPLMKVCSGRFVLCRWHQPWIFTACLSGDNNDCLRPSSCQMSVPWDFACLTHVTLIFGSSVASLRQGICYTQRTTWPLPLLTGRSFPNQKATYNQKHFYSGKIFWHMWWCSVLRCLSSLRNIHKHIHSNYWSVRKWKKNHFKWKHTFLCFFNRTHVLLTQQNIFSMQGKLLLAIFGCLKSSKYNTVSKLYA